MEKKYVFSINESAIKVILMGLGKLTAEVSHLLMSQIEKEIERQDAEINLEEKQIEQVVDNTDTKI